jgi:hypothetical protein
VSLDFVPSYATLCTVQGLLVLAPSEPFRLARSSALGLLLPAAMLGLGVGLVNAFSAGADALTTLAAVATPLLAAFCARIRGWPFPWLAAPAVAGLYVYAWRGADSLGRDAAHVVLIGLACLTGAALLASVAPRWALAAGLVLLVVLDIVLVWGDRQVAPTTVALHHAAPPAVAFPGGRATPLPALQDVTFGTALMGWLDLLAPAVLASVLAGTGLVTRAAAAFATAGAGLCWGLLLVLHVTSPIPATVPVLVGLAVALAIERSREVTPGDSDRRETRRGGRLARLLDDRPEGELEPLR